MTTANVEKFSQQIKRALKIPFSPKSGGRKLQPHYAILINSKKHTNDADLELHEFIRDNPNIKVLSQENVCELILNSGIGPQKLIDSLSKYVLKESSKEDKDVYEAIKGNVPAEIDILLDYKLKFMKEALSVKTKELVIEYIYDRWQQDRSRRGTVKPMKWFDTYFDFMTEKQYIYLISILEELSSSNPSFDALCYTQSIVEKITPTMLKPIEDDFIKFCAKFALYPPPRHGDYSSMILKKIKELRDTNLITGKHLGIIIKIIRFKEERIDIPKYEAIKSEIREIAYPELAEMISNRRKRRKNI